MTDAVERLIGILTMSAEIWERNANSEKCPTFSRGDCREWRDRFQSSVILLRALAARVEELERERDEALTRMRRTVKEKEASVKKYSRFR